MINGLTPKEIVAELDKYIIGQNEAKKVVAIALRNRDRRQQLAPEMRDEIAPKNIIMMGPTGVGKTEVARRLSRLAGAPFIKVEATKYTEVGYVGRDVESMVRDLVEIAVGLVRSEKRSEVVTKAQKVAEDRLLDILIPPPSNIVRSIREGPEGPQVVFEVPQDSTTEKELTPQQRYIRSRQKMRDKFVAGGLEDREVELEVKQQQGPMVEILASGSGLEDMGAGLKSMMERIMPPQRKQAKMKVSEARRVLTDEAVEELLDMDKVVREALKRAQESGIIFIDEFDKIAGRGTPHGGPDVSREGVQRDILPIVEGSTVMTKYGAVQTDHILFIAAGAFHASKPSDLIPELQGRFPLRVELKALSAEDFVRILTEPQNALTKQYVALLGTEGLELEFVPDGVEELARSAFQVNTQSENIGARRLYTLLEKVLEDLSFNAPDLNGQKVVIDSKYVRDRVKDIIKDEDLSKFIL
ncbi:MAG: ATP-dependent protease ATPase subunit HslU [bacterium]